MTPDELWHLIAQDESPKLDFKIEYTLTRPEEWNELIKDILALANGNVGHADKTGYLVIGVGDVLYENHTRDWKDANGLKINRHDLLAKINAVCIPRLPDLRCEKIKLDGKEIQVITIPPSPHLYELKTWLQTSKRKFQEHTVFIRCGDEIQPVSQEECRTIAKEKRPSATIPDPVSQLVLDAIAENLSKIESRKGSERMKNAYLRARTKGYESARRAPAGLALVGSLNERHYTKDEKYFPAVVAFLEYVADGKSIRQAAILCQKKGYKSRSTKGTPVEFDLFTAYRIKDYIERYKPFLAESLYRQAKARFDEITEGHKRGMTPQKPGLLAYGLLRCAKCNAPYLARTQHPTETRQVHLYTHGSAKFCEWSHGVVRHRLQAQLWQVLDPLAETLRHDQDYINAVTDISAQSSNAPIPDKRTEIRGNLTRSM